jgi:tetratricopeptide (TPR) repeat protein
MNLLDAIDEAWDFGKPALSEERFAALAATLEGAEAAEVRTQQARSLGLQKRFDEARELLNAIPSDLIASNPRLEVRWQLEMGRTYNSGGDPETARKYFEKAYEKASDAGLEWLAIDAGHMIAIASPPDEGLTWNERCLSQAESATEPRARKWRGSLLNNLGWTLMDLGRPQEALLAFERAVPVREEYGAPEPLRIAKWCVGRALRELGRFDEALAIHQNLLAQGADGFVEEEAAECLLALGRPLEAQPHFAKAYHDFTEGRLKGAVSQDRLERIASLMAIVKQIPPLS